MPSRWWKSNFPKGAKPGKGGLLPKEKITEEISELRGVPMGHDVVSPPSHAECTDLESAVKFIAHVQEVSQLPVGIKLCMGNVAEFDGLISEMVRLDSYPDWITIDGSEGGTGAAPKAFMDRVGMPLYPSLKRADDILNHYEIRNRMKLVASGKLVGPGRQMIAFCLGADAIASARGHMLAIGCIQAMQCGNNTCPVGITTHSPDLQRGLNPAAKSERIANYVDNLEHDLEELLGAKPDAGPCGNFRSNTSTSPKTPPSKPLSTHPDKPTQTYPQQPSKNEHQTPHRPLLGRADHRRYHNGPDLVLQIQRPP